MDFTKLGQAAAESDDLTQSSSGFTREVPRAGVALLRFKDYIETGKFEPTNPTFKAAQKCMLVFELSHPDHLIEINGEKVPQNITVRLNRGTTNKSGYRKLFKLMNDACGGQHRHFVEMIGKPFLGTIYHNTGSDGKTVYANLNNDSGYSLQAPQQVDALTNTITPVPVPELVGTPKVFLWENAGVSDEDIQAMWDSIYIEGEREIEKDGVKTTQSKNWIQETIMENIEWVGSQTERVVNGQKAVTFDDDTVPF